MCPGHFSSIYNCKIIFITLHLSRFYHSNKIILIAKLLFIYHSSVVFINLFLLLFHAIIHFKTKKLAAQWVALLPHCKVLVQGPAHSGGLSVWSLHVLSVSA